MYSMFLFSNIVLYQNISTALPDEERLEQLAKDALEVKCICVMDY